MRPISETVSRRLSTTLKNQFVITRMSNGQHLVLPTHCVVLQLRALDVSFTRAGEYVCTVVKV